MPAPYKYKFAELSELLHAEVFAKLSAEHRNVIQIWATCRANGTEDIDYAHLLGGQTQLVSVSTDTARKTIDEAAEYYPQIRDDITFCVAVIEEQFTGGTIAQETPEVLKIIDRYIIALSTI